LRRNIAIALLASACCGSAALAAGPSTSLTLTGRIDHPGTFDLAALQALPSTTQTVTFLAGSGSQTHTFVGTSLWGVLDGAGIQTSPSIKNDLLNRIVVATGSDGYRAAYALGELSPNFGNRASLIAYGEQVGSASVGLGTDGFARTTAPGDVHGGRYVSNLVNIDLQSTGSTATGTGGGVSSQFSVTGDVAHAQTFDLGALQALPAVQRTVGGSTYTGVSFWDLLNGIGIVTDPAVKNDILGMYVVATGSDGYRAAFSLGELDPAFGNEPDIVAYSVNGTLLTDNGFARIVVPDDVRAGRFVSNLVSLEVLSAAAIPEPSTWLLLAVGLAAIAARPHLLRRSYAAMTVRRRGSSL
jgi:DMSO/TMAO reductase YedYZ molybdopterin-dependent catalytic subunit